MSAAKLIRRRYFLGLFEWNHDSLPGKICPISHRLSANEQAKPYGLTILSGVTRPYLPENQGSMGAGSRLGPATLRAP
jgi:hypothetical protein